MFSHHIISSKITTFLLAAAGLAGFVLSVLGVFNHLELTLILDFTASFLCLMVAFKLYQKQLRALNWAAVIGALMSIGVVVDDTLVQFSSGLLLTVQLNLETIAVNINLLGLIIIATALTAKIKLTNAKE
ncbi:hypothetical protein CBQ28_08225 [Pseudoalteromonas sp. GCY]|uniref:hypothetical protein n=1 Tax=Pseudoalteromonas sp. GCY TaxID=2003316 RepID=UPI000BFEBE65|nr:hypothetical protein [Pseudoalteromonas sp. GCY]PHI37748.1 hypothetical protein CBQ28_08225 [Pseudoalteromonas sp. GCY]QQQ68661.1 hypothetical protein JJQ94_13080 [Pseudoalteromonas sp. GCY]